jgi:hypothetical protein
MKQSTYDEDINECLNHKQVIGDELVYPSNSCYLHFHLHYKDDF